MTRRTCLTLAVLAAVTVACRADEPPSSALADALRKRDLRVVPADS
jgi:hypothetical protein